MKIEVFNENGQLIDRLSQLAVEFRGYTPVDIAAKSYEIFDLYKILAYGESDIFFTSIAGQFKTYEGENSENRNIYRECISFCR